MSQKIFNEGEIYAHYFKPESKVGYICSKIDLPKDTVNVLREASQNHEYNEHIQKAICRGYDSGIEAGYQKGFIDGSAKGRLIGSVLATVAICTTCVGIIYIHKKKKSKESE